MRRLVCCLSVSVFFISSVLQAADPPAAKKNYPVLGRIERNDSRLDKLIPTDAKIEVLASGFDWAEGPVWSKEGGFLLFSDIPKNSVMRWKEGEGEGISVYLNPSGLPDDCPTAPSLGRTVCCSTRKAGSAPVSMAIDAFLGWKRMAASARSSTTMKANGSTARTI